MIKELLEKETLTYPFVLELPYKKEDYTEYGGMLIESRETLQTLSDEIDASAEDFEDFFRETQVLDWRIELHHTGGYPVPTLEDLQVYGVNKIKRTEEERANPYDSFYRDFE